MASALGLNSSPRCPTSRYLINLEEQTSARLRASANRLRLIGLAAPGFARARTGKAPVATWFLPCGIVARLLLVSSSRAACQDYVLRTVLSGMSRARFLSAGVRGRGRGGRSAAGR